MSILIPSGAARTVALAAFFLSFPGCLWIGAGDRSDRLGKLDEDGDGVLAADEVVCGEAGDQSPDKAPGNIEIPYDGIDNDCKGGDLIDADGDTYPGISQEDYDAVLANVPPEEAETWPADNFGGHGVDCLDEPGSGGNVNPGVTSDLPYDAVDSNCDGVNEFDLDGDGYLKQGGDTDPADGTDDLFALFQKYEADYGYSFPGVEPGDCDDGDETAHPGTAAEDDVPYDGKDADCAGNNDYDADGDGFYPAKYQVAFEDYRDAYPTAPWFDNQPGDCFDTCVASLHEAPGDPELPPLPDDDGDDQIDLCDSSADPKVNPVDVFPGAVDAPYDGVDSNCDLANDFDGDVDGYSSSDYSAAEIQQFFEWWGGDSLGTEAGDCDDADPDVNPGEVEIIDGVDQDCFGPANADTAAFRIYDDAVWTDPGQVNVVRTDVHWALTVPADHFEWPAGPVGGTEDNTFLLSNLLPGTVDPGVTAILFNRTSVFPANDLVADGTTLYLGMSYLATTSNTIAQWAMSWDAVNNSYDYLDTDAYLSQNQSIDPQADDVSVLEVNGNLQWAGGCGDGVAWMLENTSSPRKNVGAGLSKGFASILEDDVGEPRLTCCSTTTCRAFEFDGLGAVVQVATPPEWTGTGWSRIERNGDAIAMVPPSGNGMTVRLSGVDAQYFTDETVLAASAAASGSDLLIAAVVADSPVNRVVLLYSKGAGETRTDLGFNPWPDPNDAGKTITGNPVDVSVAVFGDEVLVAATATGDDPADCSVSCPDDDQVGWVSLLLK